MPQPKSRTESPRRGRKKRLSAAQIEPAPATSIHRKIPPYELLNDDDLRKLERHADSILAEFGVEIRGDEESLELFRRAGAKRDGLRLRFEPGLLTQIIQNSAPREFIHHARNPARSVPVGGLHTAIAPVYGPPFVRDLKGGRRYGSLADFCNLVKLAYLNPHIHYSGGVVCEPCDIAVNKRHLDMVYAHMRWSDKPFLGAITSVQRAQESLEMCRILFGAETLERNCVILGNVNVNSPLVYDGTVTQVMRTYAAANQGIVISPFILAGAMGPVTPAASIAQAHAEAMVGVALTQLVRPGAPVIYGSFFTTMSLRTGAPTFGQPEAMLAYMAVGQLCRRLGVPLRCGGALTSSKTGDAQAGQESAQSMLPALLSGANFILQAAGWLEGGLVTGYEKFIQDADRCGMLAKFFGGLALDQNAFGMEAYREVEFGAHFLGTAHTLANYQTALYESNLASNDSYEQWLEEGEQNDEQRAFEIWQQQLKTYTPPRLDAGVDEALQDYIARTKASRADRWY